MAIVTTCYDARARAPLRSSARASYQTSISGGMEQTEESPGRNRRAERLSPSTSRSGMGPEFEPLSLAFEIGKRSRHSRARSRDSYSSGASGSSSDTDSNSDNDDGPPTRSAASLPAKRNPIVMYLMIGIIFILLLAACVFLYRSRSTSTPDMPTPIVTSTPKEETDTVTSKPSPSATSSLDADPSPASASAGATKSGDQSKDASTDSSPPSTTAKPTESESASGSKGDVHESPPAEYSGITLSGTFVDTATYAVATGAAAYVGDDKANADMSKIDVEPNEELAKDKEGKIWVGDITFYAAGKGGFGSCGTKLFDGQDIFFAAMSVYDLMGSASPAPFCYSCISLQNVQDPSKTITAIVADSCPACTLGHVDLEQKAFFALGATIDMGVMTVAWSFTDCPDGWSKEAMEKIPDSVYEEVKS